MVDAKREKNSYQDLLYNPNRYELNASSYEPLRPPRKRDALRTQKTKTAPSVLEIDPYTNWQQQEFGLKSEHVYQCSNSMNNLALSNGDTQLANNLRSDVRVISNYNIKEDVSSVYSNGNTLNFKQHMTSSFKKEEYNNRRNEKLRSSSRYDENEDDDGDYQVI